MIFAEIIAQAISSNTDVIVGRRSSVFWNAGDSSKAVSWLVMMLTVCPGAGSSFANRLYRTKLCMNNGSSSSC